MARMMPDSRSAAADEIQNFLGVRVHQHRVDGEVPPQHIALGICLEFNPSRMPTVLVCMIAAEGGNLHLRAISGNQYHAEMGTHRLRLREQAQHFRWGRIRRYVQILRYDAQQHVTNATAYQESRISALPQSPDDVCRESRRGGNAHDFNRRIEQVASL